MAPRVTVGIPTLDRADHLQFAIDSCLQQTTPVHVIVSDQGQTRETAAVMERYKSHPNVEHALSDATCLQENWENAARACDTEFFLFLQDDDTLSRVWAARIIRAFDVFPDALHVQASVYVTPDRIHSARWGHAGPQVGVNMRDLIPEKWHGEYCIAPMYITSWALSPGVAFRCGEAFNEALEAMPTDCDLFAERLILAEMGSRGDWIADPVVAGYWHHHGLNESYSQNTNGSVPHQYEVMVEHLDRICDRSQAWQFGLTAWCQLRNVFEVTNWLKEASQPGSRHPIAMSRHKDAIKAAMGESLEGRIIGGSDPVPVEVEDQVLVFA